MSLCLSLSLYSISYIWARSYNLRIFGRNRTTLGFIYINKKEKPPERGAAILVQGTEVLGQPVMEYIQAERSCSPLDSIYSLAFIYFMSTIFGRNLTKLKYNIY